MRASFYEHLLTSCRQYGRGGCDSHLLQRHAFSMNGHCLLTPALEDRVSAYRLIERRLSSLPFSAIPSRSQCTNPRANCVVNSSKAPHHPNLYRYKLPNFVFTHTCSNCTVLPQLCRDRTLDAVRHSPRKICLIQCKRYQRWGSLRFVRLSEQFYLHRASWTLQ